MLRHSTGSLRLRLLLLSILTIMTVLLVGGFLLTAIFNRHLERRVEQELNAKLLELAGAFGLDPNEEPTLLKELADPQYDQPYSGHYWQVARADGPLLRSRSLWDRVLPHDDPRGLTSRAYEAAGPDGATLYVRERDVHLATSNGVQRFRLTVAIDHAELSELGASFVTDAGVSLAVIGTVLVLGAWLQIRIGLRPLTRLQDQLARIHRGGGVRLEGEFPLEVAPLVGNLNALIASQEDSVRRARERASDLAHGLKTPLTILSVEARRLEDSGNAAGAVRVREQIEQMRTHVERQLARARSHGATAAGGTLTDACSSLERVLGLMRRMPRSEKLEWRNALPHGLRLRIDPEDFGEVVGNLLDNARMWARSRIVVSGAIEGNSVRITVDDDGPGIPPDQREVLRVRGESGANAGTGTGLGLAIVADVLALYDTTLAIKASPAGGCRIEFGLEGWLEPQPATASSNGGSAS
jgi:signal transduction histidine kinase